MSRGGTAPRAHAGPLVSVVSPCYEQAHFVGAMVRSVRGQTLDSWELVVVDDGSTDGTAAAAEHAAAGDPRVRVVTTANGGVARARNFGFRASCAGSRYVYFLDGDDELLPAALERMTGELERHPQAGMVHCRPSFVDAAGDPLPDDPSFTPRLRPRGLGVRQVPDEDPITSFMTILALTVIVPSVALIRRATFVRGGGFDEDFGHQFEDTDLFLRLALEAQVRFLPEPLVRYRRHPRQSSLVAARNDQQMRKLLERWRDPSRWPEPHRLTIQRAWRFRDRQLTLLGARRAAADAARAGRMVTAARFALGGSRVALRSFLRDR